MSNVLLGGHQSEQQKILYAIAEDLKTPLIQILAKIQSDYSQLYPDSWSLEATAQSAIRLIDSYILSTQIYSGQQQLALEPVSVSATMYDTAQYLSKLAQLHNCELEVKSSRTLPFVMAHPVALQALLTNLGYSLINAVSQTKNRRSRVVLSASATSHGVKAGVYRTGFDFRQEDLNNARLLKGEARQLFPTMLHGSGAGILIADTISAAMNLVLASSKRQQLNGLSVTLLPSYQLALL